MRGIRWCVIYGTARSAELRNDERGVRPECRTGLELELATYGSESRLFGIPYVRHVRHSGVGHSSAYPVILAE